MTVVIFYVELKVQLKIFLHIIPSKLFPYFFIGSDSASVNRIMCLEKPYFMTSLIFKYFQYPTLTPVSSRLDLTKKCRFKATWQTNTCLKSTIETLEKDVKYV